MLPLDPSFREGLIGWKVWYSDVEILQGAFRCAKGVHVVFELYAIDH